MILIFGATGTIGAPLVTALLAKGAPVRAATSNAVHANDLRARGCEAAVADFDDPAALARACQGAEKVFLVTPTHQHMRRWKAKAIGAAKEAGVRHMVLSTGLGASPKALLSFGAWHSESQELLKDSGMGWTLVQPTYFMQNVLWQAESIARERVYHDDLGGPVSWVDARDIADVAALALTEAGHEGRAYGLSGPEALTGEQIAAVLSIKTGREITVRPMPAATSRAAMIAGGMAETVADAMIELAALAPKGYLAGIEPTIENMLGRPARRLEDFVSDHADAFRR